MLPLTKAAMMVQKQLKIQTAMIMEVDSNLSVRVKNFVYLRRFTTMI